MDDEAFEPATQPNLKPPERAAATKRNLSSAQSGLGKKQSFISVNTVLSNLVGKLDLDRRLKEHALMSLWPSVINDALAQKSRPLFIDAECNLLIAVKDASAGQELSLLKSEILQRFRVLARGVGVEIKGLRFDLKHFHNKDLSASAIAVKSAASEPRTATKEQLESIVLNVDQLREIAELRTSLEQNASADANLCQRIVSMYEQELRLKQWRQSSGFPPCPACREPAASVHGADALCRDCYFSKMSTQRDI